jgi:hypothetical protein
MFQPKAVETFGPFNQSGLHFVTELGRRLQDITADAENVIFCFSAYLSQFKDTLLFVLRTVLRVAG